MRHIVLASILAITTSCASSSVVKRTKRGGVIALRDSIGNPVQGDINRERSMDDAKKKMAEHCGGDDMYEIVSEEETPTGVAQQGNALYSKATVTTEWRVTYECKR